MTEHPLEPLDPYGGDGEDNYSTSTLRKRDKFLNGFGLSKSENKVKAQSSIQSLNAPPLQRAIETGPLTSPSTNTPLGEDLPIVSSVVNDSPVPLLPAENSSPAPISMERAPPTMFLENAPAPAVKADLPRHQQRIEKVEQLVYCNSMLLQDLSTLSSKELDWLTEVKKDPMEQDHLHWLVNRMVEVFIEDAVKDSTKVAEVVALGPVLQKEPYRQLLSSIIKEFEESRLLDVNLLQGLVQLVQSSISGFLVPDDLVKILSILRVRLQGTHQQSSEHPYHLTLAVSRVLDVMADNKVQDLNRVQEHEPLAGVLSGLKGNTDPFLMYQACYAFQALQYVPDDETVLQAVLRHSRNVFDGAVKVAAVAKLDLGAVLQGLGTLQEALGSAIGVVSSTYSGVCSLKESGQGVWDSLKEGFRSGKKRPWYAAVRAAYAFAEAGQLRDLNTLICEAPCRRDPLFQWGICQLLGEIAVDPVWPDTTRQQAISLLGRLYKEDPEWGQDESIKAWTLTIIDKLGSTSDQAVSEHVRALVQELTLYNNPIVQHPYSLNARLPIPASSPILAKVHNIPNVEYDIHKFRLERLQDDSDQAVYIPPQAKPSLHAKDEEPFPLMEKVQEFLASNRQVMLILGDSGAGKSTFNRHLERRLWKEYKRGGPIPLPISLSIIHEPKQDMVNKQLQFYNFSDEQIQELKQHRQLVLICDGYDESQQLVNLHRTNSLNQPGQWDTKMVISCRTQYLGSSYHDRFRPQSEKQDLLQEAVIAPFSLEQITSYVEQFVESPSARFLFGDVPVWSSKEFVDKLQTIPNLLDLARNPFLLTLALRAFPKLVSSQEDLSRIHVTRVSLYDKFVEQWLEVNKQRLWSNKLSGDEHDALELLLNDGFIAKGIHFQRQLSNSIFKEQDGIPVVQYSHLRDKQTWKARFFAPDPEVRLLRECCPLTRTGHFYRFVHRSVQEYFYSCVIYSPALIDVGVEQQSDSYATGAQSLDANGPLFTQSLIKEPSIVQFLCDRVQQHPQFKQQLLDVIELSKTDAVVSTAAANAITILVRAGVLFNSANLRGIQIPGADLTGGQFDSAQLQGADLTRVDLSKTWLRKADFSNAHMEGVRFGELPYLEVESSANSCCFSSVGAILAVGLGKGPIILYSTSSWLIEKRFEGHTDAVNSLFFSADNQYLVSGGEDHIVRLWDCIDGKSLLILEGHTGGVNSVVISPCGRQIASASEDSAVRLWSSETGECLFVLNGHTFCATSVKFLQNGRQLVSSGMDPTIRFWDVETGEPGAVWESGRIGSMCLAISPDGQRFITGHITNVAQLWDVATGERGPVLVGHTRMIISAAFSPDRQWIATSSGDSSVRLWDSSSGAIFSILTSDGPIFDVSFTSDSSQIAAADSGGMVRLWDVRSSTLSIELLGHTEAIFKVAYFPDGRSIISGSGDRSVRQWDSWTGAAQYILSMRINMIFSMAFSSDNNRFATFWDDKTLRLLSRETRKAELVLRGHTDYVYRLTYSHCNRWIASASFDRTLRLWDLTNPTNGFILAKYELNHIFKNCLVFSPDGHQLAFFDPSGKVYVYDTQKRLLLKSLPFEGSKASAMAYSSTSSRLAIGNEDGSTYFWDFQSEAPGAKLDGGQSDRIDSIAYSPCDQWIAIGTCRKTLALWRRESCEVESWSRVAVIHGFFRGINDIAWNPVVPLEFVTGSEDRSVRVWRVSVNGGSVSVGLVWGSNLELLYASDAFLKDVIDLDPVSKRLLTQRGAIDG